MLNGGQGEFLTMGDEKALAKKQQTDGSTLGGIFAGLAVVGGIALLSLFSSGGAPSGVVAEEEDEDEYEPYEE